MHGTLPKSLFQGESVIACILFMAGHQQIFVNHHLCGLFWANEVQQLSWLKKVCQTAFRLECHGDKYPRSVMNITNELPIKP
jgi:hypothetical protein